MKIWKSIWFPVGFTVIYLSIASAVMESDRNSGPWAMPFKGVAAFALAFMSSCVLWIFYGVSFILKFRRWPEILLLAGLLSPVLMAGAFLLYVAVANFFSGTR